jgi:MFS family permease
LLLSPLTLFLNEKKVPPSGQKTVSLFEGFRYWKHTNPEYRKVAGGLLLFALFNSSDVLLFLKMKESGHADSTIIGVYIFYNLVYALLAYPMGRLADKMGIRNIFLLGLGFLLSLILALHFWSQSLASVVIHLLWNVCCMYRGRFQGLATNIVSDREAATAIGTYTGQSIAALIASSLAGLIWFYVGPAAAFLLSALVSLLVITWLRSIKQLFN